jgi:hypothetical protein
MTRDPEAPGGLVTSLSILEKLAIHIRPGRYRLAGLVVLLALGSPCATRSEETPERKLVYRTAGGVTFEVTGRGLTRIGFKNRDPARGEWSVFNAESWFTRAGTSGYVQTGGITEYSIDMLSPIHAPVRHGSVQTGGITEYSIDILSPTHARVRHSKGDILCVFDYTFDGEDATIRARVENNHATAEMAITGFSGLEFTFGRVPDGLMYEQHISYFQAHGIGLCHPSHFSPIGGSYARDDSVGIGISPWQTGLVRTLLLWDYTDWNPGKRGRLPSRRLIYFVTSPVPPRGAQTFALTLRVSPDRDCKHLLEPYRGHFQATFGPLHYKPDSRWIATDYLNHSQAAVSPENPYGFHGGHRRIDTAAGARAFCDTIIPVLKANDGQGVIVWGQGGEAGCASNSAPMCAPTASTSATPSFRSAAATARPRCMASPGTSRPTIGCGVASRRGRSTVGCAPAPRSPPGSTRRRASRPPVSRQWTRSTPGTESFRSCRSTNSPVRRPSGHYKRLAHNAVRTEKRIGARARSRHGIVAKAGVPGTAKGRR